MNLPSPPIGTSAEAEEGTGPLGWLLGLFALLALLVVGGAWYFLKRKPAAVAVPTIERPIVPGTTGSKSPAVEKRRYKVQLEIAGAMRSMMMVTVNFRVTIANRSDKALRDITISADLVSARRSGGNDQIVSGTTQLPAVGSIERIGPHQSQTVSGTVQLPTSEIEVLRQGQIPMFVPLLRLKVEGESIDTHARTYAVGMANEMAVGKVHPLPLNGPPGSYQGVRAAVIDPVPA